MIRFWKEEGCPTWGEEERMSGKRLEKNLIAEVPTYENV
ncbi:MAG: hypothetical protein ACJAZ8_000845 [Planctomycetota bacterium]|jgi:hypothetical protein